jgi:hypothetical protein
VTERDTDDHDVMVKQPVTQVTHPGSVPENYGGHEQAAP